MNINENATYSDHINYRLLIAQLIQHYNKKYPHIPSPKVKLIHGDIENAKNFFGKTAYYDPNTQTVVIYTEGRHPTSILNSLSHEMIHHIQNFEDRLSGISGENVVDSPDLESIEREAYENGGFTLRTFKDSIRNKMKKINESDELQSRSKLFNKDIVLVTQDVDKTIEAFEDINNYGAYASSARNKATVEKAIEDYFGPSHPIKRKSLEKQRGKPFPPKTKQAMDDLVKSLSFKPSILFYQKEGNQLVFPNEKNRNKENTLKLIKIVMNNAGIDYKISEKVSINESKIKKSQLKQLIKEWIIKDINKSNLIEEEYFSTNEIKVDPSNSYSYEEVDFLQGKGSNKSWKFEDRCGNVIYAVYTPSINEFKTGFKIEGVETLIFQPEKFPHLIDKIRPCPDDKKIGTIYKILTQEIIPNFVLNKKPNKLYFNPVSPTRNKLTNIIINKIIKDFPQLTYKDNYIIYR